MPGYWPTVNVDPPEQPMPTCPACCKPDEDCMCDFGRIDLAVAVHWATATQDDPMLAAQRSETYTAARGNLYVKLVELLLPGHDHYAPQIAWHVVSEVLPGSGPEPARDLIQIAVDKFDAENDLEFYLPEGDL